MKPVVLIILDGWGYSRQTLGNAIASAETPRLREIQLQYPSLLLQASGPSVGLSWRESGNSEVGHLTIGAGRTVFQYSTRISRDIESGAFFENPALINAMLHANQNQSTLHILGLLGSGSVHSSFDHLQALTNMAKRLGVTSVKLHLFGDGKDSGLKESIALIGKLQAHLSGSGAGTIASIVGRKYAMDRNDSWSWTQKAYDLWVSGVGRATPDLIQAINEQHNEGLRDSELEPILVDPNGTIQDNDAIIFFNFREDSMRQIARAFTEPAFSHFQVKHFENLFITCMTQYLEEPRIGFHIAFPPPEIHNGLAEAISQAKKNQLHIAETEKYAHVTYFFNCLRYAPFEGEDDILLKSNPDPIQQPDMRALDIAQTFQEELKKGLYEFFVINIANADILAHQGILEVAIASIGDVDMAVSQIVEATLARGGVVAITSDHGNAESMVYAGSGDIETKHNPNPVPLIIIRNDLRRQRTEEEIQRTYRKSQGILSDVAPTILDLMDIKKPVEMTGESLLSLLT